MNNAQLIKRLPELVGLRREKDGVLRQLNALTKRRQVIEEDIRALAEVTEIYEGVALRVYLTNDEVAGFLAAGDDIRRAAEIYLNQHNHTTWGVRCFDERQGRTGEHFLGKDFTRAEAELKARDWVAKGN